MDSLLAKPLRIALRLLFTLLMIIAVLLVAGYLGKEWSEMRRHASEAQAMELLAERLRADLGPLQEARVELQAGLESLARQLADAQAVLDRALEQEQSARKHLESIRAARRWYYTPVTHAEFYARLKAAEASLAVARKASSLARKAGREMERRMESSAKGAELLEIQRRIDEREQDVARIESRSERMRREAEGSFMAKVRGSVLLVLPTALWILAGIVTLPLLVKTVLYFAVAPWIARARPILLLPGGQGGLELGKSAVSVSVPLAPGEELVVHSAFLQALGTRIPRRTQFLLSWSMPLTSLAAGLLLMVRLKNDRKETETITVAPKKELFDKLCTLRVPAGSAMVMYPRSLVGVVLPHGEAPRITRHWCLNRLHAWVTFQFRYLVIHGPCRLVVKGCRGVRAEPVRPDHPRQQDQNATLGFSANLSYAAVRCETFVDYLLGRDDLFNDRFAAHLPEPAPVTTMTDQSTISAAQNPAVESTPSSGPPPVRMDGEGEPPPDVSAPAAVIGHHLTEEIPDPKQRAGFFGRGIEGVTDAFLKAFGI